MKISKLTGWVVVTATLLNLAYAADDTKSWNNKLLKQKSEWYATAEARAAADNVLLYQSAEGAWPKNHDLLKPPASPEELAKIQKEKGNTIDNGSTTAPLKFLAFIAEGGGGELYQKAVFKGIDYLLASQYANGGFPQFYPLRPSGYYSHITYNDNAMISVMELLREVAEGRPPFTFVDDARRERARAANEKGIACILKTQIREEGNLTVWCAQHDEVTLEPAWARKYEPPSLSGSESVGVVRFLMGIEKPTPEIIAAIEAAVSWLDGAALRGIRLEDFKNAEGKQDRRIVEDATASPMWARFYELKTHRPIFLGRDSKIRYTLSEIEHERRNGYAYYGTWPASLLERDYPKWRAKHGLK